MTDAFWLSDFAWDRGAVRVKKTGARLAIDGPLAHEVLVWLVYFAAVQAARAAGRYGRGGPVVAFTPDRARPWYLIWPAVMAAGGRVTRRPEEADLVVQFDDAAESRHRPPDGLAPARLVNFAATDIRKSRVAAAFEQAFGYPLALDPRTGAGPAVEKSEGNGVHDGRIVMLPRAPQPGMVCQRLIDNAADDGLMEDLRTPTVGGVPVCVFVKRRTRAQRFTNHNVACPLRTPQEVFSAEEIAAIGRFCALMGLDWAGLDILRDRADGRIYVVDANKTDMGPPIAMTLSDKLEATRRLGRALAAFATARARAGTAPASAGRRAGAASR